MIIAINARCLDKDVPGGCGSYMNNVFERITKLYREHTFIFISAKPLEPGFNFPANAIFLVTGPQGNTSAKWLVWYNIKIPFFLKKYRADVFVSPGLCSLTTKIPQCLILHDLSFLHFPLLTRKSRLSFFKRYISHFLKKPKTVITLSEFSKATILERYKLAPNKLRVAYAAADEIYKPLPTLERDDNKKKYSDGNEYFIYTGVINSLSNLMNLLKAFSAFKKRQKSNMQLLIAIDGKGNSEEFFASLKSYKFRNDIKLLKDLSAEENSKIIASAYAMVYIPFHDDFGMTLFNAMKCEVPVITSSTGSMPEICGDAALYASPENFKEIAVKMMLIFKDENLRKNLIERGKRQVQKFTWDNTAVQVWDSIKKTVAI